jgi:hypothetical protein
VIAKLFLKYFISFLLENDTNCMPLEYCYMLDIIEVLSVIISLSLALLQIKQVKFIE